MAARSPRRTFATPFVVTLAAAPACFVGPSTPPPSQPTSQPTAQPEATPVVVANPPRPTPTPTPTPAAVPTPPPAGPDSWYVSHDASGCTAMVEVQCPQGATCNPPPPQKYACPPGLAVNASVTVIRFGDGCAIKPEPISCPPRAMCNPPRPTPVACPK